MLVVLGLPDRAPHFVQQRREFQEFSIAHAELVESPGRIEQLDGLTSRLSGVGLVVAQPPPQFLDDAPPESGAQRERLSRRLGDFGGPRRQSVGIRPLRLAARE
jgi:hypothetical protein